MDQKYEVKCMQKGMLQQLKQLHFLSFGTDASFDCDYYDDIVQSVTPVLLLFDKSNSKMVGFSVIDDDGSYILTFAIHLSYRRQGLGYYLLNHTINYIKNKGCLYVTLNVCQGNIGAIKLYQKCGFVTHEELIDYYGDNELIEFGTKDAYFMKRYIESNDKYLSVTCICGLEMKQRILGYDEIYICDDCFDEIGNNIMYQCGQKLMDISGHKSGYDLCLKCIEQYAALYAIVKKTETKITKPNTHNCNQSTAVEIVSKLIIYIDTYLEKSSS